METPAIQLARELAGHFSACPGVEAVALGGSQSAGSTDTASDIDVYVYSTTVVPLEERQRIAALRGTTRADMNLTFWDLGDEWFDAPSGIEVDMVYWPTTWIEDMIRRVVVEHQASVGYSTCFWHTVRGSLPLFDRSGWFARLQAQCQTPYPPELRRAVLEKNMPLLRDVIPSYAHQIEKAMKRGDLVSVNHRVAALLASYFDALFAFNEVLNPGEKRLIGKARSLCQHVPHNMETEIHAVLAASGTVNPELMAHVHALIDGLEEIIKN